jgi:hypothetical protein
MTRNPWAGPDPQPGELVAELLRDADRPAAWCRHAARTLTVAA